MMKRLVLSLVAAALLGGLAGCAHRGVGRLIDCGPLSPLRACRPVCQVCQGPGCHACRGGTGRRANTPDPMGAVTYPYYTLRGPRDFLASDPRSIGP